MNSTSLIRTLSSIPLFALITLYCFAMYFKFTTGSWPQYQMPDAGTFSGFFLFLDISIFIVNLCALISPIAVLVFFIYHRSEWKSLIYEYILFIVTWSSWVALLSIDLGGIVNWYLD